MRITTRELAELTPQEQTSMAQWCKNVLQREAGRKRRKTVATARAMAEGANNERR